MLNIRFSLSSRRIRLDKLPWATFNTSNGSLVMAVFYFPLSLSLFLLLLFTRLEPPSEIALEGRIKRRYIFYILDFYLFRAWSDDSRQFTGYWFSWKSRKYDEMRFSIIVRDLFWSVIWFCGRKLSKISGLILDSLLRRFSLQQWDFWNLILWCKFSIADFEFIEDEIF